MEMREYLLRRKQNTEEIKDKIVKTIRNYGLNVNGRVEYNGSAISIEDDEWHVRMWLRLTWDNNANKCVIFMSNINLHNKIQRKGIFTNVIKGLKTDKYIDNIVIQSVSSDAMRNWCKKHRFKPDNYGYDYFWKA